MFAEPNLAIPKWVESKQSYGMSLNKMGSISVKRPMHRLI